jgi:hypothetical protein
MEEPPISPMCIIGLPTPFTVSYMPSPESSYYALKFDAFTDTPMDCGTMVVCIEHTASVALNFEV